MGLNSVASASSDSPISANKGIAEPPLLAFSFDRRYSRNCSGAGLWPSRGFGVRSCGSRVDSLPGGGCSCGLGPERWPGEAAASGVMKGVAGGRNPEGPKLRPGSDLQLQNNE